MSNPVNGPPVAREETAALVAGQVDYQRYSAAGTETGRRAVPEEVPIAIVVNETDYAVMLASPADVEDFAYGFLFTEGVIRGAAEVESLQVLFRPEGTVVQVHLHGGFAPATQRKRRLAGVSSCGLCGVESLRDAIKPTRRVGAGPTFPASTIIRAMSALRDAQPHNAVTGAMHAAAFANTQGEISYAREDVGRHNALDKLIGVMLRQQLSPAGGFVVMSSRCSYELVQKAASFDVRMLCTASAPTALAVRLAAEANLSLVTQVRADSLCVVAGGQRLAAWETDPHG